MTDNVTPIRRSPPIITPAQPTPDAVAEAIRRHERTPRHAFDVFLACSDDATEYDFKSETVMQDDTFVITITATPKGKSL